MKIINVVGARPNFMKIAPIVEAITAHNTAGGRAKDRIDQLLVHTGQHYDARMSRDFFVDLGIPTPDVNLEVGPGSHAEQTAGIMRRFEPVLVKEQPDAILVVGDVNSTIACALTASKLGVQIIHVEAGLRSFDRTMPEEINRVLTDAISDLLFTTEKSGSENLLREGIAVEKIHFVGNVMIDTLLKNAEKASASPILSTLQLASVDSTAVPYALVTLHRPSNVDSRKGLQEVLEALIQIAKQMPVIFPVHPRTKVKIDEYNLQGYVSQGGSPQAADHRSRPRLQMIDPLGYLDFLHLMANARLVLTDSGGIQEETTVLGVPCLTMRDNTERPVTVQKGTNRLVGSDPARIVRESLDVLNGPPPHRRMPPLWDGKAAERIVGVIGRVLSTT